MTKTIATILALAAAPALAQTGPSDAATGAATTAAPDVIVTASRSGDAVPVDQLGASVTIIDAAALEQRQVRVLSDVLRDVPGVAVNRSGGPGSFTQVRLRGTEGDHTLVLIDGIQADDPYQGSFDFATLIADEGARVEVIRGQQSSLYGSSAIGGVIQYLTLTGREAPGVTLHAEGGSLGTGAGSARVAGVAGTLDYALTGSIYHTEGAPLAVNGKLPVGDTSAAGSGKFTLAPSDAFKVTAVGRYSYTDAGYADFGSDPTVPSQFGRIVDTPGAHYVNHAIYGLVSAELALADGHWSNALTGQIAATDRANFETYGLSFGDKGQRYKGSFVSTYRFGSDAVQQRLTGAVDVTRERFRNTTPFSFTGYNHTDNIGLVGEYEAVVHDALALGGSVRRDLNTRFADMTTARGQASLKLGHGLRVRGAYGTGVKNPLPYDLFGYSDGHYEGNPNLKPEKSKGWEVGVDKALGSHASISGTYFDSILVDRIYLIYPAPLYVSTPANFAGRSRQHGVEVFASATPLPQLRFDLAYTYTHSTNDGVTSARRPAHIASVNATVFSPDKRLSGTLTVRYNGRQADDAYTDPSYVPVRVSLADYALVNVATEYRLAGQVSLFGRVENVTGTRYQEAFSYASQGRTAYAGVKARF